MDSTRNVRAGMRRSRGAAECSTGPVPPFPFLSCPGPALAWSTRPRHRGPRREPPSGVLEHVPEVPDPRRLARRTGLHDDEVHGERKPRQPGAIRELAAVDQAGHAGPQSRSLPMVERLLGEAVVRPPPPSHLHDDRSTRRPGVDRDEVELRPPDVDVAARTRQPRAVRRSATRRSAAEPARWAGVRRSIPSMPGA